jgi:hypothetical protein
VDQRREGLTSTTPSRPDTKAGGRSVADLRTRTSALQRGGVAPAPIAAGWV